MENGEDVGIQTLQTEWKACLSPVDRECDSLCASYRLVHGGQEPKDFPHGKTVYHVSCQWRRNGLWSELHDRLRWKVQRVWRAFDWVLQTVLRPMRGGRFVVLPKRWIVERTFAWLSIERRLSKDYERNPRSSEMMIQAAMITLMLRRLAKLEK